MAAQVRETAFRRFFLSNETHYYVFTGRGACILLEDFTGKGGQLNYLSSAGAEDFVIKNMIPGEFEYQLALQSSLASCPNLRTAIDTVPAFELLVYRFLASDVLQISQKPLAKAKRKCILKNTLSGLAGLHDKGIIHTGKFV